MVLENSRVMGFEYIIIYDIKKRDLKWNKY